MSNSTNPWLVVSTPRPAAKLRLICFHYAGGGASVFRQWDKQLPAYIEVASIQLPGREERFREPLIDDLETLSIILFKKLIHLLDKPYAVFGHSMGCIVSYEWLRLIRENNLPPPLLYIPAGRQAPHIADKLPPLYHLPEQAFVESLLKEYPDTMKPVLENEELRQLSLPKLRADFTLAETYRYKNGKKLDCPILALAGKQEYGIEENELFAWGDHTVNSFSTTRLPGDHFFIHSSESALLYLINSKLKAAYNQFNMHEHA